MTSTKVTDEMVERCCKAIWYSWNKPHVTEEFRIAMRRVQRQGFEAAMVACDNHEAEDK